MQPMTPNERQRRALERIEAEQVADLSTAIALALMGLSICAGALLFL